MKEVVKFVRRVSKILVSKCLFPTVSVGPEGFRKLGEAIRFYRHEKYSSVGSTGDFPVNPLISPMSRLYRGEKSILPPPVLKEKPIKSKCSLLFLGYASGDSVFLTGLVALSDLSAGA